MPANRSRTEKWRDCLNQICERGGGLEFAIDQGGASEQKDLVWRVHVYRVERNTILIEHPGSMGQSFPVPAGTPLVGIMAVGQNRWMFRTSVLSVETVPGRGGPRRALRIESPQTVERCIRRNAERTSTLELALPTVDCWPLLDVRTAAAVEIANRAQITELLAQGGQARPNDDAVAIPEVGPRFEARLANIGGGGVGLIIPRQDHSTVDSVHPYFLRIDLRPSVPAPLLLTARVAHTHIDSQQNTYAGLAFDFAHDPDHKSFVVGEIARYVGAMPFRKVA